MANVLFANIGKELKIMTNRRRVFAGLLSLLLVLFVTFGFVPTAEADALDEILEYTITVDVNEDGTLTMLYHLDWKVLDSTSEGPLSWIKIGIPNSHGISVTALSDTISKIDFYSGGGNYVRVDLDRKYYAGEVVSFDFELIQDYMYEMNRFTDGETYYEFTPGWFDAKIDSLVIKWNSENVLSVNPACLLREDGYYTWTSSLGAGDTYTVSVTYLNNAYSFDDSKTIDSPGGNDSDDFVSCVQTGFSVLLSGLFFPIIFALPIIAIIQAVKKASYSATGNFSGGKSKKVITREKIVYHPSCPGCGAPRPEGKDVCEYCGRSLIKSKETVSEKQIPEEMRKKESDGIYRYSSDPNTFMRVHVTHVPITTTKSSGSSSRSSSSRSSSCAHSSCACAHSCACACACACAGGGRAGCSTKDFYNTDLKLEMLEKKKKARSNKSR